MWTRIEAELEHGRLLSQARRARLQGDRRGAAMALEGAAGARESIALLSPTEALPLQAAA
jgi:hypothetical protein